MIYFISVNYHSTDLIRELIKSIKNNIKADYQFIIVNNSPEDTSINQLKSDSILIIDANNNLGFGVGCNLGINYVYDLDKNALIWLINPDTTIDLEADNYILKCLQNNPNISILGTKIRDVEGKIWFSKGTFNPWLGSLKHEAKTSENNSQIFGITECRWVCGCSLIINLSQFDHCPSFDSQYFLYGEDADFCEQYYQKGYTIAITNDILVTHAVSSIIGKDKKFMYYHYTFGRLLFLRKHAALLGFLIYFFYILLIKIPILLPSDKSNAIGRWRGIIKFIKTSFNDQ